MSEKMELAEAGLRHADGLTAQLDRPHWVPSRAHIEQARNSIKKLAEMILASSPAQEPVTTEPIDPLAELIAGFAKALLAKLRLAEANGRSGWEKTDWESDCQQGLLCHVAKGDPRDVAAYCAFMWHHDWIAIPAPPQPGREWREWRQIETAPKNGTFVDLLFRGNVRIADCIWYRDAWWATEQRDPSVCVSHGLAQPTHWMPIPMPAALTGALK